MIKLHVTPAEGPPFDHAEGNDELVIGRSRTCDLSIEDRFLSRRHARLYREGDSWLIEDLGSRNGTFVNGRRIERPEAVRPGDVLTMSASRLELLGERSGDDSASTGFRSRPATDVLRLGSRRRRRSGRGSTKRSCAATPLAWRSSTRSIRRSPARSPSTSSSS